MCGHFLYALPPAVRRGQTPAPASRDIDWRSYRSTLECGYTIKPSRSTASASA